jgi:hypothetical protein
MDCTTQIPMWNAVSNIIISENKKLKKKKHSTQSIKYAENITAG